MDTLTNIIGLLVLLLTLVVLCFIQTKLLTWLHAPTSNFGKKRRMDIAQLVIGIFGFITIIGIILNN